MINRFIGIDTEYHTNQHGIIDKVFCIAATTHDGRERVFWLPTYEGRSKGILDQIANELEITDPIFVCHAFEKAERRALKFLGVPCHEYHFVCTYHLAKMLSYSFTKSSDDKAIYESDEERASTENAKRRKSEQGFSYAALCAKYHLNLVDTRHKETMRHLCITDETQGHEDEIMRYCLDDTRFLIPLFRVLFNQYANLISNAVCPLSPNQFKGLTIEKVVNLLVKQCEYLNDFGDIADEGLPVSETRVEIMHHVALPARERIKSDFNLKYSGTYHIDNKTGFLKQNTTKCQEYLSELITSHRLQNYPMTSRGKLSMSSKVLKDYFKGTDTFGEHFRQMNKKVHNLNNVSKTEDNPLDYMFDGHLHYDSLRPFGTITSRCAPSTKRFLFGWHKSFYGLLNPRPGRWLVELDYSSQETFIQACICKDSTYNDIYNSKDIYLAFAALIGMIPKSDFDALPKSELKKKYHAERSKIKPIILGMSYGMGATKLSQMTGLLLYEAKDIVAQIGGVIHKSTEYKRNLIKSNASKYAFALPDGFICRFNATTANVTTVTNWPFQSSGGMILRHLVHTMMKDIRSGALPVRLLATIHDAIFFEVDEGDYDSIERVKALMISCGNYILSAPESWSIKVGEPEIIKHGEIWTPEHAHDDEFKALLEGR